METLQVKIRKKIASFDKMSGSIVCRNKKYQIEFDFDEEWDSYAGAEKTAVFIFGSHHIEKKFKGNVCPVPALRDTLVVSVGVYIEDEIATTDTTISCVKCIICKKQGTTKYDEPDEPDTPDEPEIPENAETDGTFYYAFEDEIEQLSYKIVGVDDSAFDPDMVDRREVEIPNEYNGKPVTLIATNAFSGFSANSVTIPDGAKIGSKAFYKASVNTIYILNTNAIDIAVNAFEECSGLESIYCAFDSTAGEDSGAPWGADKKATIEYDYYV